MASFRNVNLITKLVDMVCKIKDHMQQGFNYNAPPIEMAIRTLGKLVRAQPIVIWLYKLPIYQQVKVEEYQQIMSDPDQQISPFREEIQGQEVFYLDTWDIKSLFLTEKRTKIFWELCFSYLTETDSLHDLSKTMAHLCYRNYDFSRKIGKVLLTGLNKTSAAEVRPYSIGMMWYLQVPDEFQQQRLEWILGVSNLKSERQQYNTYGYNDQREQIKVGLGRINDVMDLNFDYNTPLLKDQSKMCEPVFMIMYNYRKAGFMEAVLELLEFLLQSAINDNTNAIFQFILNTPGPSYIATSYWDWLEPYIKQNIQEGCSSYQINQSLTEKNCRIHGLIW